MRGGWPHDGGVRSPRRGIPADIQRSRRFRGRRYPCSTTAYGARWRSPTSGSRSRSLWWCARCGVGRCAWTCARRRRRSASLIFPGPRSTVGWPRFVPARCSGRPRCCDCSVICCTSTGTGLRKNKCAPICSRCRPVGPAGELPGYERLFPPGYEEQRIAADIALAQAVTVLTGGPGTGKTHTVARLLALLVEHAELAGAPAPGSRWPRRPARRPRG